MLSSSILLASGTVTSRITGFIKLALISYAIGQTGVVSNAFSLALAIPNTLYLLIAGGVLNAIFVPQIAKAAKNLDGGASYTNKLLSFSVVSIGIVTVSATLLTPVLVQLFALGAIKEGAPDTVYNLAVSFAYWCIPQIFFYGCYTVLAEVLNAKSIFGPAAWAPIANNLVAMVSIIVFISVYGAAPAGDFVIYDWRFSQTFILAFGATLGVVTQLVILIFFWPKTKIKFRFDISLKNSGLRDAGKASAWVFGILLAYQLSFLVTSNLLNEANNTSYPGIAVINTATLLFMLPHSVITMSLATPYFTRMSHQAASRDFTGVRTSYISLSRLVAFFMLPASFFMLIMVLPITRLVVYAPEQLSSIASVFAAHFAVILFFSLLYVIQRCSYAMGDSRSPFLFFSFQYAFYCVFSIIFVIVSDVRYHALIVSIVYDVSVVLSMCYALYLLQKKLRVNYSFTNLFQVFFKPFLAVFFSTTVTSVAAYIFGAFSVYGFAVSSLVSALLTLFVCACVFVLSYLFIAYILKVPELMKIIPARFSR